MNVKKAEEELKKATALKENALEIHTAGYLDTDEGDEGFMNEYMSMAVTLEPLSAEDQAKTLDMNSVDFQVGVVEVMTPEQKTAVLNAMTPGQKEAVLNAMTP